VVIVPGFTGTIKNQVRALAVLQEPHLIILTGLFEVLDCLIQRNCLADKRHILLHKILHCDFDAVEFLLPKIGQITDLAIVPSRGNRMVNRQFSLRKATSERNFEQEDQRAAIDARPIRIFHGKQRRLSVLPYRISQFTQMTIQNCTNNQRIFRLLHNADKVFEPSPSFTGDDPSVTQCQFHACAWFVYQIKIHYGLFFLFICSDQRNDREIIRSLAVNRLRGRGIRPQYSCLIRAEIGRQRQVNDAGVIVVEWRAAKSVAFCILVDIAHAPNPFCRITFLTKNNRGIAPFGWAALTKEFRRYAGDNCILAGIHIHFHG